MNESEYITDVSPSETSLPDYQSAQDTPAVSEVTEVTDSTTGSTSLNYDMEHIQHNTDGIFMMTCGIFFVLVIMGISKLFGGFFSM